MKLLELWQCCALPTVHGVLVVSFPPMADSSSVCEKEPKQFKISKSRSQFHEY